MEHSPINNIDPQKIAQAYKHLPQVKFGETPNQNCSRCLYINETGNNFCTNCGYPLHKGDMQLLYQFRLKQRKEMLKKNLLFIQIARVFLYSLSALLITACIGFMFGRLSNRFLIAIIALASAVLFLLLARWSLSKPFTALLTAFVIILTFTTIAVFGEFTNTFTSVRGVYTIAGSFAILFFLLRGVQGAYKADLINEEMQVN
ncbi:zinc ribbon domain-containing protein [Panacibacter ginsenosidivorans]|uniref:Zinc ribbon domain-containing protein n=1 Tax=Panacibacter ginsenosidivorans TaxID=1813871 RepID=A0A5B8V7K7_9BACT|nr:zinc ribbon domain-containing protein [Panacibacter ginsenosidivorans]QEC67467.1 zinc ribbon domain-containing protein [Panacibacter ginsenosidivorans]